MKRTHYCGELTRVQDGQSVTLMGWVHGRRDHGGVLFIDVRDRFGVTQLVFDVEHDQAIHEQANELRNEFVIAATGTVRLRPEESVNPQITTGEIEIQVGDLDVLNRANTPPFLIEGRQSGHGSPSYETSIFGFTPAAHAAVTHAAS